MNKRYQESLKSAVDRAGLTGKYKATNLDYSFAFEYDMTPIAITNDGKICWDTAAVYELGLVSQELDRLEAEIDYEPDVTDLVECLKIHAESLNFVLDTLEVKPIDAARAKRTLEYLGSEPDSWPQAFTLMQRIYSAFSRLEERYAEKGK